MKKILFLGCVVLFCNNIAVCADTVDSHMDNEVKIVEYTGDTYDNMREGFGKACYDDGSIYEGYWNDDMREGFGKLTGKDEAWAIHGLWSDDGIAEYSIIYEQGKRRLMTSQFGDFTSYYNIYQFDDSEYEITITDIDGTSIAGEETQWEDDRGSIYFGIEKNGRLDGAGIRITAEGYVYVGEFTEGTMNGVFHIYYPNGDMEIAAFKEGSKNGPFTYIFSNNTYWSGVNNEEGKCEGMSVCRFSSGSIYTGEWTETIPNGWGVKFIPNGEIEMGIFQEGNLVDDDIYEKWTSNGITYFGIKENGNLSGKGIILFGDGSCQIGDFENGKLNGNGAYFVRKGLDRYNGLWTDGKMNGEGSYFWLEGFYYAGEFQDNKKNGMGEIIYPNGVVK